MYTDTMKKKSGNFVRCTAAEMRAMEKRGEIKSDWKAAAQKPLPSGRDPDDAMKEIAIGSQPNCPSHTNGT
jgi:hypothetical protein